MKSKDIKAGMIVGVLSTGRLETYSSVHRYEVIDVGPWEMIPHSFHHRGVAYPAPEGVTLPEGVEWPDYLDVRKTDSWRSGASSWRRSTVGVLVVCREEGHPSNGTVRVLRPAQIRGEHGAVVAEVKAVREAADDQQKRVEAARARRQEQRAELQDRLGAVMEAAGHRPPMLRGLGTGDAVLDMDTFEALLSLAEKGSDA